MTEENISIATRLSIQRALLGAITPNVRMVTLGWEGMQLLKIRVYFDVKPRDEQVEDFEAVCAEVIADVAFERDNVECIYSLKPMKELERLSFVVYARKEDNVGVV